MVLSALEWLYGSAVRWRNRRYDAHKAHVVRVAAPVLSVGNCSAGGTGKSPFVRWLAEECAALGVRSALVSRGYGRTSKGAVLVSNGMEILANAATAGDEALMNAEALLKAQVNVPVLVDEQKSRAAHQAVQEFGVGAVIVDDGFQHRRLHRDCDIVIIDRHTLEKPFLLPKGLLREPLESLRRAHVVCCINGVRGEELPPVLAPNALVVEAELRAEMPRIVFRPLVSTTVRQHVAQISTTAEATPILALSSIANPERFHRSLGQAGFSVAHKAVFPDHHRYGERDVQTILRTAQKLGLRTCGTTEKDVVKLYAYKQLFERTGVELFVLPVRVVLTQHHEQFQALLRTVLARQARQ
jgi:tetraacyldisaccharide 4'-kinase